MILEVFAAVVIGAMILFISTLPSLKMMNGTLTSDRSDDRMPTVAPSSGTRGRTMKLSSEAPCHYNAEQADAWASGYNAALEEIANPGAAKAEPANIPAVLDGGDARPNRRLDSSDRGQPFFSTQWEREDYERRIRGDPELGPLGATARCRHKLETLRQTIQDGKIVADICRCIKCGAIRRSEITPPLSSDQRGTE